MQLHIQLFLFVSSKVSAHPSCFPPYHFKNSPISLFSFISDVCSTKQQLSYCFGTGFFAFLLNPYLNRAFSQSVALHSTSDELFQWRLGSYSFRSQRHRCYTVERVVWHTTMPTFYVLSLNSLLQIYLDLARLLYLRVPPLAQLAWGKDRLFSAVWLEVCISTFVFHNTARMRVFVTFTLSLEMVGNRNFALATGNGKRRGHDASKTASHKDPSWHFFSSTSKLKTYILGHA